MGEDHLLPLLEVGCRVPHHRARHLRLLLLLRIHLVVPLGLRVRVRVRVRIRVRVKVRVRVRVSWRTLFLAVTSLPFARMYCM